MFDGWFYTDHLNLEKTGKLLYEFVRKLVDIVFHQMCAVLLLVMRERAEKKKLFFHPTVESRLTREGHQLSNRF
jgi:hypothetical protein